MVYTFIKGMGGNVGNSLCEDNMVDTCMELLKDAEQKGVRFILPTDTLINSTFSNEGECRLVPIGEIPDGYMGLDIGPESIVKMKDSIYGAKTILWNGPMGVFEFSHFENGTKEIAYAIATATDQGAFSLVGGGDSVAAVGKYNLKDRVSYVSTGGGAMLEYIEGKELPGIKAILG
jgi:phosphoglycerate kinase